MRLQLWDVRVPSGTSKHTLDFGPHSANWVALDATSALLAVASQSSASKLFELAAQKVTSLAGHEDAVQSLAFDFAGEFLLSAGSDQSVRLWS